MADNGDCETHTSQAEGLSVQANNVGPAFLTNKFYLTAYPLIAGPGGESSPQVRDDIQRRVRTGALIMNYTGHGSEFQWADERILDPEMISTFDNGPRLPFFVTATCEFGRLDDPSIVSSAENLVLKADGGAIGMFSACRPVYSASNVDLNSKFLDQVFKPINGEMPRLGDVLLLTKNRTPLDGSLQYFLLGDPSLRLAYPRHEVVTTGMTDASGRVLDTLSALQTVVLHGAVYTRGTKDVRESFNGRLQVTLFDKKTYRTVTDNGTVGSACPITFNQRKSIIFNGYTRVENGLWTITFQLPLDINYVYGNGLFSFYAEPDHGLEDANGVQTDSLVVGGSAPFVADDSPPKVQLYMNDFSFRSGGIVGPNPVFLARLSDNTGLNVSLSGVGHEMTGVFSYDAKNAVVMNSFYVSDLGAPNQGTVSFPLSGLKPGSYMVTFKAFDLQNNSATDSLRFTVRESGCPTIARPFVTPNPVSDKASFSFDIDQPGKAMQVEVRVFDMLGRHVGSAGVDYPAAPARAGAGADLQWNAHEGRAQYLPDGVYQYKVLTSSPDGCQGVLNGRMVINR